MLQGLNPFAPAVLCSGSEAGNEANSDIAQPPGFTEPFDSRRRVIGRRMFEVQGIDRKDRERRRWWVQEGLRLFGAPVAVYICTDRAFYLQEEGLNAWPLFDCGLVAENIMLLAVAHGLGTVAQIQAVSYPDVLRNILQIPDSKIIVLGIAMGYPDWDNPINQLRIEREPLAKVVTWRGFDD